MMSTRKAQPPHFPRLSGAGGSLRFSSALRAAVGKTGLSAGVVLWAAFPAALEASDAALGIPLSEPWQSVASPKPEPRSSTAAAPTPKAPLEDGFWDRLRLDCAALERSRSALLQVLRSARGRPAAFEEAEGGFDGEHSQWVQRLWLNGADHDRALESLVGRYRDFSGFSDPAMRAAALQTAFAARLAQWRWRKGWSALLRRSPELCRVLDQGNPAGFPKGLHERARRPIPVERIRALAGRARRGDEGSLLRVLGKKGLPAWRRRRAEDLSALGPGASTLRSNGGSKAAVLMLREALSVEEELLSSPDPGLRDTRAKAVASSGTVSSDEAWEPGWLDLPLSSQTAIVVQRLQEALAPDPPTGPRPEALISVRELKELRPLLEPGDILLLRRETALSSVGAGGWWRVATLYGGGPQARLLAADASGAGLLPLEALRADALAVLRPRLPRAARDEALRKARACLGPARRPDSALRSKGCPELSLALSPSTEMLWNAYEGSGLRLPRVELPGRAAAFADGLARGFDEDYGTGREQFDFVVFLDPRELWQRSEPASVETFRASWRRPAWTARISTKTPLLSDREARP